MRMKHTILLTILVAPWLTAALNIDWTGTALKSKIDKLKLKVNFANDELPDNGCPVCQSSVPAKLGSGIKNKWATFKAKRQATKAMKRFTNWTDTLLVQKDKADEEVSANDVVAALTMAGKNYDAITSRVQTYDLMGMSESAFIEDTLALVQAVSSTSAGILNKISTIIGNGNTAKSGVLIAVTTSILDFFQRVNVNVVSVILGDLNTLTGATSGTTELDRTTVNTLLETLSAPDGGGIFLEAISYLKASSDESGLAEVLAQASADVSSMNIQLTRFLSTVDGSVQTTTSNDGLTQGDALTFLLDSTISLLAPVISILHFTTEVFIVSFPSISIFLSGRVNSILGMSIDNLISAVDLYKVQGTRMLGMLPSTDDDLQCEIFYFFWKLYFAVLLVAYGSFALIVAIPCLLLFPNICSIKQDQKSCQMDAYTCQSDVLSTAIQNF